MVPLRTIDAGPIKSLHNATSRCWSTFNVDFTNTCRIACPTHSIVSNPVGLWLSPPIKTPQLYVFPQKNNEKLLEIQFFFKFLRFNAKTRKNRFLDRSPARIDFSLVETPFWDDFRAFRGRGLFATIFACIGALWLSQGMIEEFLWSNWINVGGIGAWWQVQTFQQNKTQHYTHRSKTRFFANNVDIAQILFNACIADPEMKKG